MGLVTRGVKNLDSTLWREVLNHHDLDMYSGAALENALSKAIHWD
jgi:hypothetical protein